MIALEVHMPREHKVPVLTIFWLDKFSLIRFGSFGQTWKYVENIGQFYLK